MLLHIIRHGDPDYQLDSLTAAGRLEAAALAERFAREGLDRIYTSPQGRAFETMRATADRLGLAHTVLPWAREQYPELFLQDGERYSRPLFQLPGELYRGAVPLPTRENWLQMPVFDEVRDAVHAAATRIEAESDALLASLGYGREGTRYRLLRSNTERVAVFCHAGLGLTWLAHLLEIPAPLFWSGFFLPPSSVTTILFEERSADWAVPRCIALGDTGHLQAAGLPRGTRGLEANVR